MEYINPIWFYLMDAVNGIKIFSVVMILVLVVLISCVAVSAYKECSVVNQDDALRTIKKLIIAAFIFMVIDIITRYLSYIFDSKRKHMCLFFC